jgi:hypothetical protein
MNDDLERTLRDSLQRHAGDRSDGNIDDVYARVERRRARRRSIAVLGSVAVVGCGIAGIAAISASGSDSPPGAAGIEVEQTTTTFGVGASGWACTGYVGSDGYSEFYSQCTSVDMSSVTTCLSIPSPTAPATTAVDPASDVVVSGPPPDCATGSFTPYPCAVVPTSTILLDPGANVSTPATTAPPMYDCNGVIVPTTVPFTIDTTPATSSPAGFDCRQIQPGMTTTTTSSTTTVPGIQTSPEMQTYVVEAGDSLFGIAALYGIDPMVLVNFNSWPDCLDHPLFVGDTVIIPPGALIPH